MQVKKLWLLLAGSILLMELAPEVKAGEEIYPVWGNPREGRKVYAQKGSANCHAINGVGSTLGPDLGKPFEKPLTIAQLAGAMWNHAPQMHKLVEENAVEWTVFRGSEMENLIAYLFLLQHLDKPGNVNRGARLFDEKRCSTCHAIAAEGSKIGPDLSEWKRYQSPILWVAIMWKHAAKTEVKMRQMGLKWPKFKGNEIVDLVSYIKSQANEPRSPAK